MSGDHMDSGEVRKEEEQVRRERLVCDKKLEPQKNTLKGKANLPEKIGLKVIDESLCEMLFNVRTLTKLGKLMENYSNRLGLDVSCFSSFLPVVTLLRIKLSSCLEWRMAIPSM